MRTPLVAPGVPNGTPATMIARSPDAPSAIAKMNGLAAMGEWHKSAEAA